MNKLNISVLGAGHLGRIHIQQLLELPEQWTVTGFYDPSADKCEAIAKEFGLQPFSSVDEAVAEADAVDIVTPTLSHFELAKKALIAGKHTFIEKPITNTIDEAKQLVDLAASGDRKVQVGHVERFNPAFQVAQPVLGAPLFIETHRLAQFNPRGIDVSVILDLMIHDLDITLKVVNSPVRNISASGVAVVSDQPDIANARIEFESGCIANLTASRISMKNMRKSRFFQKDAYVTVDMLEKKTEIVRMRDVEGEADPFAVTIDLGEDRGMREISFDRPEVPTTNAIREELRAFGEAIDNGRTPPVSLRDGYAALQVAHEILEKIEAHGMKSHS